MAVAYQPHRFTREQSYVIAGTLDPDLRYELLDGTIYEMSPAKPPHAGVVTFFANRFNALDRTTYLVRTQDTLEIDPDGSPQPDIAIVGSRSGYYGASHPTGTDAKLVIEVSDTERKPRDKTRAYMHDGRIPVVWCIDLPNRCMEIWKPGDTNEPFAILLHAEQFAFADITFTVDEVSDGPRAKMLADIRANDRPSIAVAVSRDRLCECTVASSRDALASEHSDGPLHRSNGVGEVPILTLPLRSNSNGDACYNQPVIDWKRVPYPPWWLTRAAARRRELDAAVERLRAVVAEDEDIVGALVFGSYATGMVGPENDLDIMLVTVLPAGNDPGSRHALLAQRLSLGVPCDLIVYEVDEFAMLVRERSFVAQARREGMWIGAAAPA